MRSAKTLSSGASKFYAASVTTVFEYLHKKTIIYRDLKPENMLIDREGYLKMADFGFAKRVPYMTYTLCGTPDYIAPEVLTNKGHGKGVDWWTLGILIYEMLTGSPPFVDQTSRIKLYEKIMKSKPQFPSSFPSSYAKSLVRRLLVKDLTKRYGCRKGGAADIKGHKWFKRFSWDKLLARTLEVPWKPTIHFSGDTANFGNYPSSDSESCDDPIRRFSVDDDPFRDFGIDVAAL